MPLSTRIKKKHMDQLAEYRHNVLWPTPKLHHLFLEVTTQCNERCRHCGSRCGEPQSAVTTDPTQAMGSPLTLAEYKRFLDEVREDFDISGLNLCITGGEPLLYPDFYELMKYAHESGYTWGMTTNGTLIDKHVAHRLAECGMCTVSVSVDGLRETHDWFRQHPGAYDLTMRGIEALVRERAFKHVQVTTVVHHSNIDELEEMYDIISRTGVRSWRVINIEPIGRAKDDPELMLDRDELRQMMDFIRTKRTSSKLEVTYGCSHYLGPKLERELRPWYFLCNAGIYSASIDNTGNIIACLDIPRLPDLVQGNIRNDRFSDIWQNGYEIFRSDYRKQGKCTDCRHYAHCAGDSFHTWDFEHGEPGLCMKGILFK